jgi:hypothetical protein
MADNKRFKKISFFLAFILKKDNIFGVLVDRE